MPQSKRRVIDAPTEPSIVRCSPSLSALFPLWWREAYVRL